jgi:hypothetical protein
VGEDFLMTTQFGSFDGSQHGAFIRSPLFARNDDSISASVFIGTFINPTRTIHALTSDLEAVWTDAPTFETVSVGVGPTLFYPTGGIEQFSIAGASIWSDGASINRVSTDATHVYTIRSGGTTLEKWLPGTGLVWSFSLFAFSNGQPAIDLDGNVFVNAAGGGGSSDLGVYKIDSSGNHVTTGGWPYKHGESIGLSGFSRFATDSDGNVYSITSTKIRKLTPAAAETWTITLAVTGLNGIAVDADHNVYVAAVSGGILKYNSSAVLQWTYDVPSGNALCVAVDADGNVYGGYNDGTLVKLDSAGAEITTASFSPAGVNTIDCLPGCHPHFQ